MESTRVNFFCLSVILLLSGTTSAQTMPEEDDAEELETWQLVAIIVPCVVGGLTLLVSLIYCCCCRGGMGGTAGCCPMGNDCCGPAACYCGPCCGDCCEPQQHTVMMTRPTQQCGGAYSGTKSSCSGCQGGHGARQGGSGVVVVAPRYTSRSHVMPTPIYSRY